MTITRTKAQKLLSASEYRLYESSRRGVVDDHGATRLTKLIATTRKQLEKYQGRAFAQTRAARGKGKVAVNRSSARKAPPSPAENTALKVEIFSDILARFEAAHARAAARPEPDRGKARPKARKAERKAAKKAPAKKAPAKKAPAKKAASKKAPAKKAPAKKAASKKAPAKKAKPSKKALTRSATKKAEVRATAASKRAPIAEERPRKNVAAAKTKQLAHGAARGRRNQAKRDKR